MEINILGSGGNTPPPRPGCQCRICRQARARGVPYARTGPSLFIFDEAVLFNAPEDLRLQLNRENIDLVEHLFVPCWKSEFIQGLRHLEALNYDLVVDAPIWDPIKVYLPPEPEGVGTVSHGLELYERQLGIIKIRELRDCQVIEIGGLQILPAELEQGKGFYFVIFGNSRKVVYCPTRYEKFEPLSEAYDPDLFIVPCFFWRDQTIFKREIVNAGLAEGEMRFENMLEDAIKLRARKIIVTHIEEDYGLSYRDLQILPKLKYANFPLEFAYDGMRLSL